MSSFRSAAIACITVLIVGFFTLDFLKTYTRYEFLVKGDVCIAFDRQEDALKVIGVDGCMTIPLTKTMEQKMREKIEEEVAQKLTAQQTLNVPQPIIPATPQMNMQPTLSQPMLQQ